MEEISIMIAISDNTIRDLIVNKLNEKDYSKTYSINEKISSIIMEKNKPDLVIIDLEYENNQIALFFEKIKKLSYYPDIILISNNNDYLNIRELINEFSIKGILPKPINFKLLFKIIDSFKKIKSDFFNIKNTNKMLFESYNQLEFLTTVIMNDYENDLQSLDSIINKINLVNPKKDLQIEIERLIDLYEKNKRLVKHFYLLREIGTFEDGELTPANIIEELKIAVKNFQEKYHISQFKIDITTKEEKIYCLCISELLRELFTEIIYSLSMPTTKLCRNFHITLTTKLNTPDIDIKSKELTEIQFISDIQKPVNEINNSMTNIVLQQTGFGYFVIKNIVESMEGIILLKDITKDNSIETCLTILLPMIEK